MRNVRIGIAGYMGSGKSTCAQYFKVNNGFILDADEIGRSLIQSDPVIKHNLKKCFGEIICSSSNQIKFDVLGSIVFTSFNNLLLLNSIVHPKLIAALNSLVLNQSSPCLILDAALIPYWHIEDWFDMLLWIDSPRIVRYHRLQKKNIHNSENLHKRLLLQERLFSEPGNGMWKKISNNDSLPSLEKSIHHILNKSAR